MNAYFAGGCFWCITPIYKIYGVDRVTAGYSGGDEPDPFDPDGQFIDRGRSYTAAVYYQNEEEKAAAERWIAGLEAGSGRKVHVSVEPFKSFFRAEEEHQDYYFKNPEAFEKEMRESGRRGTNGSDV